MTTRPHTMLHCFIAIFLLAQTATAQGLEPGGLFPNLRLPSVYDGEEVETNQLLHGKKTMLHLFASW